ncbi:MAG TPA: hypothetical protein VIY86_11175, partial [Pirellulaceae bacterium]
MNPKTWGILALLVALWLLVACLAPGSFLQANNIENLLRRTAMHGFLGIGVAFVIITGGIDLSVGSLVGLAGCLLAALLQVAYVPEYQWKVTKMDATHGIVRVVGSADRLTPGAHLRFSGGRRAPPAMLTVVEVDSEPAGAILHVAEPLTRDDQSGNLARMVPVRPLADTSDDSRRVVLEDEVAALRSRDQLRLLDEKGNITDQTIDRVEVQHGTTICHLRGPPGLPSSSAWAIPLLRRPRASLGVGLACVLGLGLVVGLAHGLLVTKLRIQPFIVTLCGLLIYRGVARWMVNDRTMGFGNEYHDSLGTLASGKLVLWSGPEGSFGIPYVAFLLFAVVVLAAMFLNHTIWGRYLLA